MNDFDPGLVCADGKIVSGRIKMSPQLQIREYESRRKQGPKDRFADIAEIEPGRKKYARFPFSSLQHLEEIRRTPLRSDDVLLCGYPKTGQTMVEAVISSILSDDDVNTLHTDYNFIRTPFIDAYDSATENGLFRLQSSERQPRTLRTHLPVDMIPLDVAKERVRTIYTIRDPKDTMVSLYHFCRSYRQLGLYTDGWDGFFELILSGEIPYGNVVDHFVNWWRFRDHLNVLFVRYEDFISDPVAGVKKLAQFLGKNLCEESVARIVNATSFQNMRNNDKLNLAPLSMAIDQTISPFIRKGEVGDWKNHFSNEQVLKFNTRFFDQMTELNEEAVL